MRQLNKFWKKKENTKDLCIKLERSIYTLKMYMSIKSIPLDIHTYYDTRIQIWTKEVVDAVIEIVRRQTVKKEYITMVLCLSV